MKATKFTNLILSGETILDKMNIFYFLITKNLQDSIRIKNEFGRFYFPEGYDPWQSSVKSRPILSKEFDIDEGTFIDVGANVGRYSLIVSRNPSVKVIAIEPAEDNFYVLDNNIKLSGRENIHTLRVAASNENTTRTFYLNDSHGGNSLINKTGKQVEVQCLKIDTLIDDLKVKDVELIKIDVEGAEVEVVEGCKELIEKHSPKFIIEVSSLENLKKILKLLEGYKHYNVSFDDYCFYREKER